MATFRELRDITLEIISAADLKDSKRFGGKQEVYAVAYVHPDDKKSTSVDREGGRNPVWNSTVELSIEENLIAQGGAAITLEIRSRGALGSSKLLGSAKIPIPSSTKETTGAQTMALELSKPSEKEREEEGGVGRGVVSVSVLVGETRTVEHQENPEALSEGLGEQKEALDNPQKSSRGWRDELKVAVALLARSPPV